MSSLGDLPRGRFGHSRTLTIARPYVGLAMENKKATSAFLAPLGLACAGNRNEPAGFHQRLDFGREGHQDPTFSATVDDARCANFILNHLKNGNLRFQSPGGCAWRCI